MTGLVGRLVHCMAFEEFHRGVSSLPATAYVTPVRGFMSLRFFFSVLLTSLRVSRATSFPSPFSPQGMFKYGGDNVTLGKLARLPGVCPRLCPAMQSPTWCENMPRAARDLLSFPWGQDTAAAAVRDTHLSLLIKSICFPLPLALQDSLYFVYTGKHADFKV